MARQYLEDAGIPEASTSSPLAANTATTITNIVSNSLRYFLIPAYDSRPGKIYIFEAGGLITTSASASTLTISPFISTTSGTTGTTLGASIAQTCPVSSLSGPWYMRLILICQSTGDPGGSNATIIGTGFFQSGGVAATANSGMDITIGGTSAVYDHHVAENINLCKTLSVAGRWT